jgi:hypothetical protein
MFFIMKLMADLTTQYLLSEAELHLGLHKVDIEVWTW